MAEIEHFVDPQDKSHPRFAEVQDVKLRLLPATAQLAGELEPVEMTAGEAVSAGVINNETLGYFMARTHLFLIRIGIRPGGLRFRQHMSNEMAHYACDCWDAEIRSSYGWIECVGCADRSAYDLTVHARRTGVPLVVRQHLTNPISTEKWVTAINRKTFGVTLRKAAKPAEERIAAMDQCELEKMAEDLQTKGTASVSVDGIEHSVTKEMIVIEKKLVTENVREYIPNVIEPSFGIGRILYSLIEHSWWIREGGEGARSVFSFPSCVAPCSVLVLPLSGHESLVQPTRDLAKDIRLLGIAMKIDDTSASVGKRYARNDELGTPFGITVDFQTVKDHTVTLRERDTTKQIREKVEVILKVLKDLVSESVTWEEVSRTYPEFTEQQLE